ncbi:MAG: DUF2764 domain-containing protein, partial [Parabacteroides sp.]
MAKYYYLIAGLPSVSLDDSKLPYTVERFHEELEGMLSSGDKKLIDLFFLQYDNRNLLRFCQDPEAQLDARGTLRADDFAAVYQALKEEEKVPKGTGLPPYMVEFLRLRVEEESRDKTEQRMIPWEDRLAALYYAHAMKCGNAFVAQWYEMNLNIRNLLTAFTCRKYGYEKSAYIVGDNEVAGNLRTSNARDFNVGDLMESFAELQRIAEESDLLAREKKVDLLKWRWLDDQTFFKTFDIESVFAYLLKIEMAERWATLDKTTGEQTFRAIVGTMKKGSDNALDEFKRNNRS